MSRRTEDDDRPTREEVLKFECPQCGAWKGNNCKQYNRAMGYGPIVPITKPTSRLHKGRVALAVQRKKMRVQVL